MHTQLPLSFKRNIDTAGTAEQLVPSGVGRCLVTVQAFDDNANPVVLGSDPNIDVESWGLDIYAGATATAGAHQGYLLKKGQEFTFVGDPSRYWLNARTAGDGAALLLEPLA